MPSEPSPLTQALTVLGAVEPWRPLERGETLFRQGDPALGFFLVAEGRLRLQRTTAAGDLVTVHVARAGESVAEPAIFGERYHCDAVADLPSRVGLVRRQTVLGACRADPELALMVVARLAADLQSSRARFELRNVRSARDRVRLYLGLLASPAGFLPDDRPLAHLASDIGLTPEAFYRAVAELRAAGVVAGSGRHLTLRVGGRPQRP